MEGRKSFVLAAGIPQMASLRATRTLRHAMLGLGHAPPKLPKVRLIGTVSRFVRVLR